MGTEATPRLRREAWRPMDSRDAKDAIARNRASQEHSAAPHAVTGRSASASHNSMPMPVQQKHISRAVKIVAGVLSGGTAAISIFTFARSYGLIGAAPAVLTV